MQRMLYDGKEECIFSWSNHFLITYELGFSYTDDTCDGKYPYSQHYRSQHDTEFLTAQSRCAPQGMNCGFQRQFQASVLLSPG